jgi:hypothetical protein
MLVSAMSHITPMYMMEMLLEMEMGKEMIVYQSNPSW